MSNDVPWSLALFAFVGICFVFAVNAVAERIRSYEFQFAFWLWWHGRGISLRDAFLYPCDPEHGDRDAHEDAREEISCWGDSL